MFVIQVGTKTKFKYELQGVLETERIYQSLNIKMSCPKTRLVRTHKHSMNIKKRNYQNTNLNFIRLVYFLV